MLLSIPENDIILYDDKTWNYVGESPKLGVQQIISKERAIKSIEGEMSSRLYACLCVTDSNGIWCKIPKDGNISEIMEGIASLFEVSACHLFTIPAQGVRNLSVF